MPAQPSILNIAAYNAALAGMKNISLFFVGLITELIQLDMAYRSFSWGDLFRDFSGGMIVLFWKIGRGESSRFILRIISVIILFVNVIPFGEMALDEYRAYRDFPLLSGFENESELSRWNGGGRLCRDNGVQRKGKYSCPGKIH